MALEECAVVGGNESR
ncbi:HTH-type transcriptional regulator cynR [Escherichia coli P12b]|nr:HTH-type transcriptional regulator cynR [Escherichia coli P12b]